MISNIPEIDRIYRERGENFLRDLFDSYIIVSEKINASDFYVARKGEDLSYMKKGEESINLIDRTLALFYEKGIQHFEKLSEDIKRQMPNDWVFGFDYFPGESSIYGSVPPSGLILSRILIKSPNTNRNIKTIEDPRVISEWAKKLQVQENPPLFAGKLDETRKQKIIEFLSIPKNDLQEIIGTESFFKYLFNILDPKGYYLYRPLLAKDDSSIFDSIIFKFIKPGEEKVITAKLVDPYLKSMYAQEKIHRRTVDSVSILLLDLMEFIENHGIKSEMAIGEFPDEKYLSLICSIYNDYMDKKENDLQGLDFETREFAKSAEHSLNIDMIPNEKTQEIVSRSKNNEKIFQIILNCLRKKRDPERTNDILTPIVIKDFNRLIDKIKEISEKKETSEFKTFGDYLTNKKLLENLFVEEVPRSLISEDIKIEIR
jgi:hypothetical protein